VDTLEVSANSASWVPITFQSDATGSFEGILTASTNDPSQTALSVNLIGLAVLPSLSLDLDEGEDDKGKVVEKGLAAGDTISAQVFCRNLPPIDGFSLLFEVRQNQVLFLSNGGYQIGSVLSGALPIAASSDSTFQIDVASTGATSTGPSGMLASISLVLGPDFSDTTTVRLSRAVYSYASVLQTVDPVLSVLLSTEVNLLGDFTGDGAVGFRDFLQFAKQYGRKAGDPAFDSRYDLDNDLAVGFPDFLIFARNYGVQETS
jgi:hypothetical protein